MGIEPTRPAWKAGVLPLNYTRLSATAIIIAPLSGSCQEQIYISPAFFLFFVFLLQNLQLNAVFIVSCHRNARK
jgi:hypothetical protein